MKHLEFIQNVITRMNNNSFALRGWAVTLVAGLLGVFVGIGRPLEGLIGLVPLCLFWLLDGYFLRQERLYRAMYDVVRNKSDKIDFSMNSNQYHSQVPGWLRTSMSRTLVVFYCSAVACISIVVLLAH